MSAYMVLCYLALVAGLTLATATTVEPAAATFADVSRFSRDLARGEGLALEPAATVADASRFTRDLTRGDYAMLNALVDGMVLDLPDTTVTKKILGGDLNIYIEDLTCSGIVVNDIFFDHELRTNEVVFNADLDVDLSCDFAFTYDYGTFLGTVRDDGTGQMYTEGNAIGAAFVLSSDTFGDAGPMESRVDECDSEINVVDLNFEGSVSAAIVNVFEFAVRGLVEGEIRDKVCEEMDGLAGLLSTVMENVTDLVVPYLAEEEQEPSDPLSAEKELAGEEDEYFDFLGNGLVSQGVEMVLVEADKMLGGSIDAEGNDLGVNVMLRDYLLDEEGAYAIPLDDVTYQGGDILVLSGMNATLESIKVFGLDTFTQFDALSLIGSQTIQNHFALRELDFEVGLRLDMIPSSEPLVVARDAGPKDPRVVSERITIKAKLQDLEASASFLLAINQAKLGSLQLGSLLRTDQIISCLLPSLRAEITQLDVSVGDIAPILVESLTSDGVARLVNDISEAITEIYEPLFLEAVPNILRDTVLPLANDFLADYLDEASDAACPMLPDITDSPVVDLRDLLMEADDASMAGGEGTSPYGTLVSMMKGVMDELLLAPDDNGSPKINELVIGPVTKAQSGVEGTLKMSGDVFNKAVELNIADVSGDVELRAFDLTVENVDSVGHPVVILDPTSANTLNNEVKMGGGSSSLRLSLGLIISIAVNEQVIRNELRLSVEISLADLLAAFLVKVDERSLMEFPIRDTLNPWCWLATIPAPPLNEFGIRAESGGEDVTLALQALRAYVQQLRLGVECISCSSPALQTWGDLLSSPEATADATETANALLDYMANLLGGEFLQVQIDRLLNEASSKCPSHLDFGKPVPEYKAFPSEEYTDSQSISFLIAIGIVGAVLLVTVTVVVLFVKWVVKRRHQAWLRTLNSNEVHRLHEEQLYEKMQEKAVNQRTKAMVLSNTIPLWIRVLMPFVVVGNIALFLSGHLSLGASVNIIFQIGDDPLTVNNFFSFSMVQTTIELWNAGAKSLAMLILFFSGIWPYSKQIATLVLWCSPPSFVSVKRRGTILRWLDALGKWSMVDIFVLIVALVAFRVTIASPRKAFLPENLYSLDLMVVMMWGLYANMLAQILSQLSSHVIIHYHDKVADAGQLRSGDNEASSQQTERMDTAGTSSASSETFSNDDEDAPARVGVQADVPKKLREHEFGLGDHKAGRNVKLRRGVDIAIVAVAVLVVCFVIVGCSIPSFQFEMLGMVGVAIEAGQDFDQAVTSYSVFGIVALLIEQAKYLGTVAQFIGLGTLSAILVVTTFAIPVGLVCTLLWLWFAPTTKNLMTRTLFRVEAIKAWQYVEVYILSIIIATWQVGGLSGFMVNEYCGTLDGIFSTMVYYGIISPDDAQCFYAKPKVESGTFVLMAAAAFLAVLSHFVTKAAAQKLHEDSVASRRKELWNEESWVNYDDDSDSSIGDEPTVSKIEPVPVHFTDTYRWLLVYTQDADAALDVDVVSEIECGDDSIMIESADALTDIPI